MLLTPPVAETAGAATLVDSDGDGIADHITTTTTIGHEDSVNPAPGHVFFYAVQFNNGQENSSYGTVSAAKARVEAGYGVFRYAGVKASWEGLRFDDWSSILTERKLTLSTFSGGVYFRF